MRIVIDLQGAQTESRYRGIGRYTLSLAKAIIRNRGNHEVLLVLNGLLPESIPYIRSEFADLLPNENIHEWHAIGPVNESDANNTWRRESAQLLREAFIQSLAPDVVHIPSLFEGYIDNGVTSIGLYDSCTPVSVSMLDLIPLLNQEQYLAPNPLYKKHYLQKIEQLKSAKKLFAISESARQEALEMLPFNTDDVVHQSIAIEPFFVPLNICADEYGLRRLSLGISKPFVLYTGGADSRKNLPALIKAYTALPVSLRDQHMLVFAGRIPEGNITELRLIAEQAGLTDGELHFTGYVSDSELVELYNLCELFVFPSWHEGFGLPVLEAMACGAPVIAANTSSLPEVIGIDEALFCPFSLTDMSNKIRLALTDINYRTKLKKNSIRQAHKFSWDTVARNTIKSLEDMQAAYPVTAYKSSKQIRSEVLTRLDKIYSEDTTAQERIEIRNIVDLINYPPEIKNFFIDISELFQKDAATGIQRVTRSLLLELLKNPLENFHSQPVYATSDGSGYYYANSYVYKNKLANFEKYNKKDSLIKYKRGDIFLGLDLQHHAVIAQQNLLRKMRDDGVYVSFVVYDLLPIIMPYNFPAGVEEIHKQWLNILAEMDHLLCISNAVANELTDWLRDQSNITEATAKISWFHLGADIENSIPSKGLPKHAESLISLIKSQPSFLCVGTLEPRKGQAQALSAFELLWQQGVTANLILVGQQGWQVDDLITRIKNHPKLNENLFWLDSISDEFLEQLYANSSCLLAVSEGEGFGLPIIEAMKHNLPIIARDIPVFNEIIGKKALYFSDNTAITLVKCLATWLISGNNKLDKNIYKDAWLTWHQSAQSIKEIISSKENFIHKNKKYNSAQKPKELNNQELLNKYQEQIEQLSLENKNIKDKIIKIKKSTSWRITYPMRLFARQVQRSVKYTLKIFKKTARSILKLFFKLILNTPFLKKALNKIINKNSKLYNRIRHFAIHRQLLS